jgi:GT2 family glycosyltransferase
MNPTPPTLSVILVTYNSAAHLRPTLDALFAQDHPSFEAILLDNASTDESPAIAREYEPRGLAVIASPVNLGYAGGNNAAAVVARGRLLVLLNPDAVLESPAALRTIEQIFAARPQIGVLGAKLLSPDGATVGHMGGTVGIPAHCRLHGIGDPDDGRWDRPLDVEFVIGALFAVPRDLWDRLGGFDEFYNPAYYEDTDFCLRVRRAGRVVVCDPAVRLIHHGNVSTVYQSSGFFWMHHKSRLWYTAKNLPLATLLFRAIPAEIAWFCSSNAKYNRRMLTGLYWMIFKRFLKRRILRLAPVHETKLETKAAE